MNKFETFLEMLKQYFHKNEISLVMTSSLHECSDNNADGTPIYWYNGAELNVINMDWVAKHGYRYVRAVNPKDNPVSTADSFVINRENMWYFIEFKSGEITAKKDGIKRSVLKKAYENWYMLLDILYQMKEEYPISGFNFQQPIEFAKNNVQYILVCKGENNPEMYRQIKNSALIGKRYTPPFMQRLKDYVFQDAYAYTEVEFEQEFVKKFKYE